MRRADQRKYHYIYVITRDDGKFYIGMHSTDDLEDGYFGSGKLLWYSINKHGKEKHQLKILELLPSRETLKLREREIVCEELIGNAMCMNLKIGGEGGWTHNPKNQLRAASAGGKVSGPKVVKYMLTDECKAKSLAKRRALGAFGYKIATTHAALPQHIETRKKTFAERGHMQGKKNSQFGTCWVTNGVKPIKIKKEQLADYLSNGYVRGRLGETFEDQRIPQ